MNIIKIIAISGFAVALSGCLSNQIESAIPAAAATGAEHIHNVQGYGDFTHSHKGNSTAGHGHSWEQIQREIKK